MRVFVTLILLSLIIGCTTVDDKFFESKINEKVWELCKTLNFSQPIDIQTLLKPYGKPIESYTEEYANKHIPNAKDYVKTYKYLGGKVVIYSVPHINRNYLSTVLLSGKFWPPHIKNYLGIKTSTLKDTFGKANKTSENKIRYSCSVETSDYIEFLINNGVVDGLKIQAWVD